MKRNRIIIAMVTLALLFALAACDGNASEDEDAVAYVNGEVIPAAEFDNAVEQQLAQLRQYGIEEDSEEGKQISQEIKKYVLQEMINQQLILDHATEEGFEAPQEEIDAQLSQIKDQYSEEEFEEILEENDLTEQQLRDNIRDNMITQEFISSIEPDFDPEPVAEEELEAQYEMYQEQVEDPESYEDIRDQLEEQILNQQQQEAFQNEVNDLLSELEEAADIEVLIDLENPLEDDQVEEELDEHVELDN